RRGPGPPSPETVGGVWSLGPPAATQVFVPGSQLPPFTQSAFESQRRVGSKLHAQRTSVAASHFAALPREIRTDAPQNLPATTTAPPPALGCTATRVPSGDFGSRTQSVTPAAISAAPATRASVTGVPLFRSDCCAAAASAVGGRCPSGSSVAR